MYIYICIYYAIYIQKLWARRGPLSWSRNGTSDIRSLSFSLSGTLSMAAGGHRTDQRSSLTSTSSVLATWRAEAGTLISAQRITTLWREGDWTSGRQQQTQKLTNSRLAIALDLPLGRTQEKERLTLTLHIRAIFDKRWEVIDSDAHAIGARLARDCLLEPS